MHAYRQDVIQLISLLAYMVKQSDKDGLDICFTQSTQKVHSERSKKLSAAVCEEKFHGISDMRTRLSHIFQGHKIKFGTTVSRTSSWYKKAGPPEAPNALSFYVLTDGCWQPNEVAPTITALVDQYESA